MFGNKKFTLTTATFASIFANLALAQDIYSDLELRNSANITSVELQMESGRQFLEVALSDSLHSLNALMNGPLENSTSSEYFNSTASGLAQRMESVSDAQSESIENYASSISLRSENLFEIWGERVVQRSMYFMSTGSLYDLPTVEEIEDIDENLVFVPPSHLFPGFVSTGGFFGVQ